MSPGGPLRALVDEIYGVEIEDVDRARQLVATGQLTARDALHVAVMQRRGITEILTFDTDFDRVPGIARRPS